MLPTINSSPVYTPPPAVGITVDTGANVALGNLPPTQVAPAISGAEIPADKPPQVVTPNPAETINKEAKTSAPANAFGVSPSASSTALNQPSAAFITQLLSQSSLKGTQKDITYDFFIRGQSPYYPTLVSFGDVKFMPNELPRQNTVEFTPVSGKDSGEPLPVQRLSEYEFPSRSIESAAIPEELESFDILA